MGLSYGFCLDDISTLYHSQQFAEAFFNFIGNGICEKGSQFAIKVNGFTVEISSGYAFVNGRWLESDSNYYLTIPPAGNIDNRRDAMAFTVDYDARKVKMEVLVGVDYDKLLADIATIRNEKSYSIVPYLIQVNRGATSLGAENIIDMRDNPDVCGKIMPLSEISKMVLEVYRFLTSGIDDEMKRLLRLSQMEISRADREMVRLDTAIQEAGGTAVGDLITAPKPPQPENEWLLCDGSTIDYDKYPALWDMVRGKLPDIQQTGRRFNTYIYAGTGNSGDSEVQLYSIEVTAPPFKMRIHIS